jgi:ATP-dependent Clp protease adapter protein ClpS
MHWSFPAGGLLLSLFLRATPEETFYLCVTYVLLIVLHEAAHATAARYCGLKVSSVELSGIGGRCGFEYPRSFHAALVCSAAGLVAQAVLLAGTLAWLEYFGEPTSTPGRCVAMVFTVLNGVLLVTNLVPAKSRWSHVGTDGYLIWRLTLNRIRQRPYAFPDTSLTFPPETRLTQLEGFTPPGFSTGIEILNDNTTPMEFVVGVLASQLQISRDEATKLTKAIHAKGGLLIPLSTYEHAVRVAAAIGAEASVYGHRLVCRPVDTQLTVAGDGPRRGHAPEPHVSQPEGR